MNSIAREPFAALLIGNFTSACLNAGVDGVYFERATDLKQLEKIEKEFGEVSLALGVLEGGGKTLWLPPGDGGAIVHAQFKISARIS